MKNKDTVMADTIRQAVAAIKAARPAYKEMLDFYEKLCVAQEASKQKTVLPPIEIPEDVLTIKRKEHFPLISITDFAFDARASEALLRRLCELGAGANEVLTQAGSAIPRALDDGTLAASLLFSKILDEDDAFWEDIARKIKADKNALAFLVYCSVQPSLSLCSDALAAHVDKDVPWDKGYCPICGSLPALALLKEEGKRYLICGFCGHGWAVSRIFCPFCENREATSQYYFYSDEEKGYRVDVCKRCKKYIKAVDTRTVARPVYPFLEQVATLHLDMLAQEQGLEGGVPLWLQT